MKRERTNQSSGECFHISPGERFKLRTSAVETEGAYTMLEMMADPRYGTPMHIHNNEDERFIVLEGSLHIANGD
jgi:mannose-6-phosphate isomerase-like protein (cupin superfamily)